MESESNAGEPVPDGHLTRLLGAMREGDARAEQEFYEIVYDDLRKRALGLMRSERTNHTLSAAGLVNEAYLRFRRPGGFDKTKNRKMFYACVALAMKNILKDHARKRGRHKRGGGARRLPLDELLESIESDNQLQFLELTELLDELEELNPRHRQLVDLKVFAGRQGKEIAHDLDISESTVDKDWRFITKWLKSRLVEKSDDT